MTDRADPVRIKTSCESCGEIVLRPTDIVLYVHEPIQASQYVFLCPSCKVEVHRWADEYKIALLRSGGVPEVAVRPPAEFLEAKTGPPIDWRDCVAFHRALSDWDGRC
jgi:hypothetical protein